jgi:hypothetical protein
MRTHTRTTGLALLAVAASLAVNGCGSSASDKAEATTPVSVATTAAGSGAITPATSGEATGGGITLPVKDAEYPSGRVHVEFGGDSAGAAEIDGGGVIIGGFANLAFTDTNRQASVTFGVGGDQPGAAAFTWDGITSGGEFGKQCTISFTKGDQTALEGEFSCSGMDGVKATSTDVFHVDATGTFRLAAGS